MPLTRKAAGEEKKKQRQQKRTTETPGNRIRKNHETYYKQKTCLAEDAYKVLKYQKGAAARGREGVMTGTSQKYHWGLGPHPR